MLRCDDRPMHEVTAYTDVRPDQAMWMTCVRTPPAPLSGYACGPPPGVVGGHRHASTRRRLLLVATLNARALEQLAVLLLGHPLAPLLDNRAHDYPRSLLITRCWAPWAHTTYGGLAYPSER